MKKFFNVYRKLVVSVLIAFVFAACAAVGFNLLVKPYAVYADGTKVAHPKIVTVDGREAFIVEDEATAQNVVREVMESYVPEGGSLDNIKIEEDLKLKDKTMFVGVEPPRVLTEEEAVEKVLKRNESDKPIMHVTTTSEVDVEKAIEPKVTFEKTDNLFEGNMELKSKGEDGEKIVTNEVTLVNGIQESQEPVKERVKTAAVDTVVYMGTGARPADTAWEDYSGETFGDEDGAKMAEYGQKYVGNPYKWGGTSLTNGADCSGFIYRIYQDFGYDVPRVGLEDIGKGVCLAEAKPGDVVYYPGHYAMYIGNGQIVHAYNSRAGICISSVHAPGRILTIRRFVEKKQVW